MKIPAHLAGNEAQGLISGEPIAQFEIGNMKNFVYLVMDWQTRRAAIVDPQGDLTEPLQALAENELELETIILTHSHHDHIAGVGPLLERMPGLDVRVGEADLKRLSPQVLAHLEKSGGLKVLQDQKRFNVGALQVQAFHTPGHSAGEYCFYIAKQMGVTVPYLFTGDTVFIRDCGRTDFPDSSNEQMFESIQRIKKFPKRTVLLVGHHYQPECATTLSAELKTSAPFQCKSVEELASLP